MITQIKKKDYTNKKKICNLKKFIIFFALNFLLIDNSFAFTNSPVRILLAEGKSKAEVTSKSLISIYNEDGNLLNFTGKDLIFDVKGNNITVQGKNTNSKILFLTGSGFFKFNQRYYRGQIIIKKNNYTLTVINKLPLENYLCGIMKMEVSPEWNIEALKAQAVVARTYALKNLNKYGSEAGYDLKPTVADQVYAGVNGEDERSNKAVFGTAGEVIMYNGQLANAFFYSDSGGYTENIKDVWGSDEPYLLAVKSDFAKNSPYRKWKIKYSIEKFISILKKNGYNLSAINNIYPLERTVSGRVKFLKIETPQGGLTIKGETLRKILGYDVLKSTMLKIKFTTGKLREYITTGEQNLNIIYVDENSQAIKKLATDVENLSLQGDGILTPVADVYYIASADKTLSGITFSGSGWGHGVGLSQWDSKAMAEQGYNYLEIINHFFPGTEVKKVY